MKFCKFQHPMELLNLKDWAWWCKHPICRILSVKNPQKRWLPLIFTEKESVAYRAGNMILDELLKTSKKGQTNGS